MLASMAFLIGNPLHADDMKMDKMDKSDMDKSAYCKKHCNAEALRSEVDGLEKELKQVQASGGKLIEVENKKEQIRKHIAQHQAELKDLQARLDGMDDKSSKTETKTMYKCAMDGTMSDKPGKCPKCGMNMEKVQ